MGSDAGRGGNDRLFGDAGDDELHGGGGFDIMDGGEGVDSVVFNGNRADFGVGGSPDGREFLVGEIATGETDLLTNVACLREAASAILIAASAHETGTRSHGQERHQ